MVYAAVITASIPADQLDAALHFYQQHILPVVQQVHGFQGVTIYANRHTQQLIGVLLYATEADARAPALSSIDPQALDQLAHFFTSISPRAVYEVVLQA